MKLQSCWFLLPYHVWCWSNYFHFHFSLDSVCRHVLFLIFLFDLRVSLFTHDENFPKRFILQRKNRFCFQSAASCRWKMIRFSSRSSQKNLELDGLWSVDLFLSAVDFLNSFTCGGKKTKEANSKFSFAMLLIE